MSELGVGGAGAGAGALEGGVTIGALVGAGAGNNTGNVTGAGAESDFSTFAQQRARTVDVAASQIGAMDNLVEPGAVQ